MRILFILSAMWLLFTGTMASGQTIRVDYDGFTVWVDCERRAPTLFFYIAEADTGDFPRKSGYFIDPQVDASCQSLSNETFQSVLDGTQPRFDVGHLVPANHFDGSPRAIAQTNFWTNLLPQTQSMNRGAWLVTEEIIECLRDLVPLEIWGGPVWGSNFDDDWFTDSHGINTPAAFWKLVIRSDNREGIAWIIPNGEAPRSSIDNWLVSVATIEVITGRRFQVSNPLYKPEQSWAIQPGCDLS